MKHLSLFLIQLLVIPSAFAFEVTKLEPMFEKTCATYNLAEDREDQGYQINRYKVIYDTVDVKGEKVKASALIAIKQTDENEPLTWITFVRGTIIARHRAPTNLSYGSQLAACVFAKNANLVVMPDLLGFGESQGFHPFLHAKTEAQTIYDLLKLRSEIERELLIKIKKKYFMSGYSQGAHAVVAAQEKIQMAQGELSENLAASIPMAGPYSLSEVGVRSILENPVRKSTSYFAGYIVAAYQRIYGDIYSDIGEIYQNNFTDIDSYYEGRWKINIFLKVAPYPNQMYTVKFLNSLERRMESPFLKALKENDVGNFVPEHPTHIVYSSGDLIVPVGHVKYILKKMQGPNTKIETYDLGTKNGHSTGLVPSMKKSFSIIENSKF